MQDRMQDEALLQFITLRLRHAVSNGVYLTPALIREAIAAFDAQQATTPVSVPAE